MKMTKRRRCTAQRKAEHLTPALLAKMDDAAIDLVIDKMKLREVTFPAITRKSSAKYCSLRRVNRTDILKILSDSKPFNIEEAQHKILQMPCLEEYRVSNEISSSQSKWFSRQLRSYLQIYDPKCPFRIAESEHLSGIEREAAVFAKCLLQRGETIQFLSGVCVPLTKNEELQLETSGKDFSILQSSRYETTAMFLGPARFVNHDCEANSKIVWAEKSRARIVAVKEIHEGDEITVFYGAHYFGENNQECLCRYCSTCIADL